MTQQPSSAFQVGSPVENCWIPATPRSMASQMDSLSFQRTSESARGGFATPYSASWDAGTLTGCIYRADGSKVLLSERHGGFKGDFLVSKNPDFVEKSDISKEIPGRGLYLGNYMGGHYGHFITETLSTFWIFEQRKPEEFDYFLFHPYVFGIGIPDHVKICFDRFGISSEKLLFVEGESLRLEEVLVPERLFRLNHSADARLKWVYQHIAEGAPPPAAPCPRLYLSRRRFNKKTFDRVVANEVEVEAEFSRRGFEVIYPETMSFEDQVGRYCRAEWLAGMSGSGLHNSIFMNPEGAVIELGDPRYGGERAPTQVLCDTISGVRSTLIPFVGPRFGVRGTMLFNMRYMRTRLQEILGPVSEAPRRGLIRWSIDALQVIYLAVRPSAGSVARRVLRWFGVGGTSR